MGIEKKRAKKAQHSIAIAGPQTQYFMMELTRQQYEQYKKGVSAVSLEELILELEDNHHDTFQIFEPSNTQWVLGIDEKIVPFEAEFLRMFIEALKRHHAKQLEIVKNAAVAKQTTRKGKETFAIVWEKYYEVAYGGLELKDWVSIDKLRFEIGTCYLIDGTEIEKISVYYGEKEIKLADGEFEWDSVALISSSGERTELRKYGSDS